MAKNKTKVLKTKKIKPPKTKTSKTKNSNTKAPKSTPIPVSIDIGEKKIWVVQVKRAGFISKAGEYELAESLPDVSSDEYVSAVAAGIKSAAKIAKVRGGKECVLVLGGPHIIVRRFVLPEMPPSGLQLNAVSEIALYLPSSPDNYNISYRVLRATTDEDSEKTVKQLEILVAAIEKNIATALMEATKQAGFKPKRIDIHENARDKLLHTSWLWDCDRKPVASFDEIGIVASVFDPNKSYALLDVSDSLINMTVFINGMFYANRYFGELVTDADTLTSEISSIFEYIHYRERSSSIESILILGDESRLPDLHQRLQEGLEIAVYYPKKIMSTDFLAKNKKNVEIKLFIDAFAAALPSVDTHYTDLDLKPVNKNEHVFRQIILPFVCSVVVIGILLLAGTLLPYSQVLRLEEEKRRLEEELTRYTVTPEVVAELTNEIDRMQAIENELEYFNERYPLALQVLRSVYGALPFGTRIQSLSINGGEMRITGSSTSLSNLSSFVVELRKNKIFSDISVQTAASYESNGSIYINFEMTLTLRAFYYSSPEFDT